MANEGGIVAEVGERVMWDVYTEDRWIRDLSTPLDLGEVPEVIALVIVVFVSVFTFSLLGNWTSCLICYFIRRGQTKLCFAGNFALTSPS